MMNYVYLLILGAIWGSSFFFIRVAAPVLGPSFLMEMRVGLAAIILLVVVSFLKNSWPSRKDWPRLLFVGAINCAIPFVLIAQSELHLTSGMASILNGMTPIFTMIIMASMGQERITIGKMVGLLLGFGGIVALFGLDSVSVSTEDIWSVIFSVTATICYGIGGALSSRWVKGFTPMMTSFSQLVGATLVLLPFASVSVPTVVPPMGVVVAVLLLSVVCTAGAYWFYFTMLAQKGPTFASLVTFLVPIFGVLWGVALLGESFGLKEAVSMACIFAAVFFATGSAGKLGNMLRTQTMSKLNKNA